MSSTELTDSHADAEMGKNSGSVKQRRKVETAEQSPSKADRAEPAAAELWIDLDPKDDPWADPLDGSSKQVLTDTAATTPLPVPYRYDVVLWLFGILFICVLHCCIIGIGEHRGWDAYSAYDYNTSNNSMQRFLSKPFTPEPGVYKRSDAEAASRWYYWKLRPELVHVGTKLFVWIAYCLHNLSVWLVLYLQQREKAYQTSLKRYGSTPSKYNLTLFGINVFFHLLHLLNTHTTYDGLAADTSEASSQSSVIVALILMLFIEFSERGILFGYPSREQLRKRLQSVWMSPVHLIRKFHGYFIYWAAIYTFWYHPMESTPGHVFGFTHTWFFMLQGSLAFTNAHLNKYWRMTMEVWVAIHAGVVAFQTVPNVMGKELWPMFFFGFTTAFILTQFYGLPFWRNIPAWTRAVPFGIFLAVVVTSYSFIKDTQGRPYTRLAEIVRIPGIYYLLLLAGWLLIVLLVKIIKSVSAARSHSTVSINEPKSGPRATPPPLWKEVLVLSGVVLTYVVSVFLSWLLEYMDVPLNLIVFTFIYSFVFMVVSAVGGSILLMSLIPVKNI